MARKVARPLIVRIDRKADAAKLVFSAEEPVPGTSREIGPGVLADYDENGEVVSIEVLGLKRRGLSTHGAEVDVYGEEDAPILPDDHPAYHALERALRRRAASA